jgi:ATP-dependent helicase/nuclease subunit A
MLIIYKSSAGSGKTFTLVKEYLKLCLPNPEYYSAILAITFTNKAAAEMKSRIIDSLVDFRDSGRNDIIDLVIAETGMSKENAVKNTAHLLKLILHSYSDFSVMTIDSFIGRLVHTFAYDLDMPLKYDVELNADRLTKEIMERLIFSADENNFTGRVLADFAVSKIYNTGSWAIDEQILNTGKMIFDGIHAEPLSIISSEDYNEAFWQDVILELKKQVFTFQKDVRKLAHAALQIIQNHDLKIKEFAYGTSGAAGRLEKLSLASKPEDFSIGTRLSEKQWCAKSAPAETRQKIEAACENGLENAAERLIEYIETHQQKFCSCHAVLKNIHSEALINQFIRLSEIYKTEKHIVPIADFPKKVHAVVKSEPVPFIYWRLGTRYRHIMIDEFQDTSRQQWGNLRPLIEESIANGHSNLAVGDGKQAIYRWRAGDVRIIEDPLPDVSSDYVEHRELNVNYRSRKTIVDFNNRFFSHLSEKIASGHTLFQRLYSEKTVPQKAAINQEGYVKIDIIADSAYPNKGEKQAALLEKAAAEIQTIIRENAGYSYRDIALLVRKNNEAEQAAQFFSDKGMDVISPDSLRLTNAPVVRFILSALAYTASEDKTALLDMWLFSGHQAEDFEKMLGIKGGISAVCEKISVNFFSRMKTIYQLPVYEAVEEIIRVFKLGEKYCGFLQGLLEAALEYSEKYCGDIHQFLEWLETDKNHSLSSVENTDAVTISTIHKAKGLEFPIVFVPFSWEIEEKPSSFHPEFMWVKSEKFSGRLKDIPFMADIQKGLGDTWFSDEYEEEQKMKRIDSANLLYVAFTRASDRLYLYAEEKNSSKDGNPVSTGHLIRQIIADWGVADQAEFSLGAPGRKSSEKEASVTEVLTRLPAYDWRKKIAIKKTRMHCGSLTMRRLKKKRTRAAWCMKYWLKLRQLMISRQRLTTIQNFSPG